MAANVHTDLVERRKERLRLRKKRWPLRLAYIPFRGTLARIYECLIYWPGANAGRCETFDFYPDMSAVQMNSQCRVLIVSRDEMLLKTRELIFGAYFHVTAVGRLTEAVAQLALTRFDLVVLCHSLRSEECERIAKLAHEHVPPAKTLALKPMTDFGNERLWADDEIGVDAGPYGLLLKAAQMLDFRIMSRAKPRAGELLGAPVRDPFPPQASDTLGCNRRSQKRRF